MNVPQRDRYLAAVAKALIEFENAQDRELLAIRDRSRFEEFLAWALPEANAVVAVPPSTSSQPSLPEPTAPPAAAPPAAKPPTFMRPDTPQLNVPAATAPPPPTFTRPDTPQPNVPPGVAPRGDQNAESSKCAKGSDSAASRKKYRSSKGKCLIAGTLSEYGGSSCKIKNDKASDKKTAATSCSASNTYDSEGKLNPKIPAEARTMCQPALYCDSNRKGICVKATKGAFANCEQAFGHNSKTVKFGKDCLSDQNSARETYNKLREDVYKTCESQQSDGALCKDCANLMAKLKAASEGSGVASKGTGTAPTKVENPGSASPAGAQREDWQKDI